MAGDTDYALEDMLAAAERAIISLPAEDELRKALMIIRRRRLRRLAIIR